MGNVPPGAGSWDWHVGGHFEFDRPGLTDLRDALNQEIEELRTTHTGSPGRLRLAVGELGEGERFGAWPTAQALRAVHSTAATGSLAVYDAITRNLAAAVQRLEMVGYSYRRADQAVTSTLLGHSDTPKSKPGSLTSRQPVISLSNGPGTIPIIRQQVSENIFDYSSIVIANWLEQLRVWRATEAHDDLLFAYRAAADRLDELSDRVQQVADNLPNVWWARSATLANERIVRIAGTARSLSEDTRVLASAAWLTAEALREASTLSLRIAASTAENERAWHEMLGQLNERYRENIDRHPDALRFDLPFGGPPPVAQPTQIQAARLPRETWPCVADATGMIGGTSSLGEPRHLYTEFPRPDEPPPGVIG